MKCSMKECKKDAKGDWNGVVLCKEHIEAHERAMFESEMHLIDIGMMEG